MHIDPTSEQVAGFAAAQSDQPVFMLNLLRFKDQADTVDTMSGVSGLEMYGHYAQRAAGHLARVGGELVWSGLCDRALIGPGDVEWDVAAVVRYPSRAAFLEMVGDPDYLDAARYRTGSLADSRLIPCAAMPLVAG